MTLEEIKFWIEKCLCKPPFSGDFPATGKYNFPQLARTNYLPEEPVLPFNYLKSTKDRENYWFHCFTSEKHFHKLYNRFDDYVELLRQAKGVISADFSLYRDYTEEILIANCRANRLIDYALQQAIPTAGLRTNRLGSSVLTAYRSIPQLRLLRTVSDAIKRLIVSLSAA